MSDRVLLPVDPETASLEQYFAERLKTVAGMGEAPGRFSLGWWLQEHFGADQPCAEMVTLEIPIESEVKTPNELLPLLSGFRAPFCLEIFKGNDAYLNFQLVLANADCNHARTALRTLFGSQVGISVASLKDWNAAAGLGHKTKLLLPRSGMYPLSFAVTWSQADPVAMLLESLLAQSAAPLLVQLYVSPRVPVHLRTDVLAALGHCSRLLEPFRVEAIRTRFKQPLLLFALRLLGNDAGSLEDLTQGLAALRAPFNELLEVKLSASHREKLREAVLLRKQGLSDSLSLCSVEELAGLWHLPLIPDYNVHRQTVREVATARVEASTEPGRVLGFHMERGKTLPVMLPYTARNQHLAVWGRSQSGKSTASLRWIKSDIEAGLGVAVIDTHDLPERLLPHIPRARWDDVLLISPRLMAEGMKRMFPVNLFDLPERNAFAVEFVTESLKEMLGRAFTKEAIGPRTSYIFDITARALLSDPDPTPHTVLGMSHIILNNKARSALAERLTDLELAEKLRGFSQLPRESFAAPLNKLEAFFRPSIQGMIGAGENGFNLFRGKHRSLLDARPIVIADLSGIPRTSAVLIGSVVMALLQLEAFRRDLKAPHDIFHVYVDEVGAFLNLENADLVTRSLQETAKFRMALTMISQGYDVIPPPVQKSLSTNMAALMYFAMGIGSGDARVASQELHGEYTEDELNALPVGHAGARLGRDVFSLYSPDVPKPADDKSAELIDHALKRHGREVVSMPATSPSASTPTPTPSTTCRTPSTACTPTANTAGPTPAQPPSPSTPSQAKQVEPPRNRKVELSALEGRAKEQELSLLLLAAGLVPLGDLCEIFFASPAYGRQFLKRMLTDGKVQTAKLGRRLGYALTADGLKQVKVKHVDLPLFQPCQTPFLEHAALVGSLAARIYARGRQTGSTFSIRREYVVSEGLRPDLAVRYEEGDLKLRLFVEADRGTESEATFIKDKVAAYATAHSAGALSAAGVTPRVVVVTEDAQRATALARAVSGHPSAELKALFRFIALPSWPVGADFTTAQIWHTADGQLATLALDFPASAVSAKSGNQ